jgi:hypothetical protein
MQETYGQWSHDPSEVLCKILRSSPDSHRFHWCTRLKNREQVSGRKTEREPPMSSPIAIPVWAVHSDQASDPARGFRRADSKGG